MEENQRVIKEYKHIKITRDNFFDNTPFYRVIAKSHGENLGCIEYFKDWKCNVFEPANETIYSYDCLLDIADFLKWLKTEPISREGKREE